MEDPVKHPVKRLSVLFFSRISKCTRISWCKVEYSRI